jgi:hypothetical protein
MVMAIILHRWGKTQFTPRRAREHARESLQSRAPYACLRASPRLWSSTRSRSSPSIPPILLAMLPSRHFRVGAATDSGGASAATVYTKTIEQVCRG